VVFAREAVDLAPKVEGTLETVAVRVGDRVERGASVATLDARSLERAVKMAEAAARASRAERVRAKVELQEAEGKLERREQLGEEHVAPEELATLQNETKLARARLEAASASVAEKRAHVDDLKATVKDTAIRTPIDGVVAARYQEPGAQVGPHAPIVRVINPATLWLRFAVTEDRAGTLAQAQPIEARVGQTGLVVKGVIRNIAPGVDPASRMIFVEAELELPEAARGSVSAGLVARVSLPGAP
jgi:RND family efflux transporter MFP subunit